MYLSLSIFPSWNFYNYLKIYNFFGVSELVPLMEYWNGGMMEYWFVKG
jgi:hypothetical protein